MKLKDILEAPSGTEFMLIEPSVSPEHKAYLKWNGVIVRKFLSSVVVANPSGVIGLEKNKPLPLFGIAVESEWIQL
jgi:hypothetical protein